MVKQKNKIIDSAKDLGIFAKTFFDYAVDTSFNYLCDTKVSSFFSLSQKKDKLINKLDQAISFEQEGEMVYRLARICNSVEYAKAGRRRINRGRELKRMVYTGRIN
ncbi:MAG: hypothetical protein PVJ67_05495 [Candidatus Pacearchaeota archaeon]|jgi:hypothetical protein